MFDDIEMVNLGVEPEFKRLVMSLCGLHNDPHLLTTTDKLRISCIEALRLSYILSKYLGVEKEEFMEGLLSVIELEDSNEEQYN
tara:strand:+ start:2367 stop:2618 length:252 start_codon:yes stop_codon:yes gene_type:complete